ncbi:ATP-grasp domain-containing protein [Streptomyces viridochromogenes]|uniref:ATP-grasp domain-containing protein n=1 Tax=Streptomyces viridochromogenes TaxID=1938 RepID=UPI00069EFFCE|nr:biotin carboxylase [Streptomyces viridochromogenes]KOG13335.1 biotin carboxylase [Streptomyces viridochromogenes]KOG13439.1 biotin carboxylase [Streptomyces viridochromogenes]
MSGSTPHVVVINRWRERYALYADYLDHERHQVTYVSTEVGLRSVPDSASEVVVVRATDDLESVRAAVRGLVDRHGPPTAIVALKEDDLLVAAALREEWNCPGQRIGDLAHFRDKYLMAERVAKAGLDLPAFAIASDESDVRAFGATHGWPLIMKPRSGSSSEGVVRLDGPADLAALRFSGEPMMVQAYNPHQIYHVDGVFTGSAIPLWRASRYVNTCLGFREGTFLGSVEEDNAEINRAIREGAEHYLRALSDTPVVFHLELFVDTSTGAPRCSFLEVGARVGGAEIPFIWRELHGYDLMSAAFQLQMGLPVPDPRTVDRAEIGGYLLIPAPAERPCRITDVLSMLGTVPGLYAEALLKVGDVLPAADAYYEHVGGRFRFRGETSHEVEAALTATAATFRVSAATAQTADRSG